MKLQWDIDKEIGFVDIVPRNYDEEYFQKYIRYAATSMGEAITQARIAFVNKWYCGKLLDVGVGSGQFVTSRGDTFGYDINETAVNMLKAIKKYANIETELFPAYSFFDSFEHIKDHSDLMKSVQSKTKIFISIPIFRDVNHILRSKHFRLNEHYWYFTAHGFVRYMADHGFACLDVDNFEIRAGREDILSFAFEKR